MKILFVSHDASRSGAPILLLHLMRFLKQSGKFEVHSLIKNDGELKSEFQAIGPTHVWNQPAPIPSLGKRITNKVGLTKQGITANPFLEKMEQENYDLVYVNSAAASDVLLELGKHFKKNIIFHIHELEVILTTYCDTEQVNQALKRATKVIAVSKLVEANLIENHHVPSEKMELAHEFIKEPEAANQQENIRKKHGLSDQTFLIGGSGMMGWRKGQDMLLLLAAELKKRNIQDIHCMWVGGKEGSAPFVQTCVEREKLDVKDYSTLVSHVSNSHDYHTAFDVYFLSSREDPFPLAAIENARIGNPIFCFKGCVGSEEYIDETTGGALDYMDISGLADKVIELQKNPEKLKELSSNIIERTQEYRVEVKGKLIQELIESTIKK